MITIFDDKRDNQKVPSARRRMEVVTNPRQPGVVTFEINGEEVRLAKSDLVRLARAVLAEA